MAQHGGARGRQRHAAQRQPRASLARPPRPPWDWPGTGTVATIGRQPRPWATSAPIGRSSSSSRRTPAASAPRPRRATRRPAARWKRLVAVSLVLHRSARDTASCANGSGLLAQLDHPMHSGGRRNGRVRAAEPRSRRSGFPRRDGACPARPGRTRPRRPAPALLSVLHMSGARELHDGGSGDRDERVPGQQTGPVTDHGRSLAPVPTVRPWRRRPRRACGVHTQSRREEL